MAEAVRAEAAAAVPRPPILRRWVGSVRVRTTFAVTVLFAVALSGASLLFVSHVRRVLVQDSQAVDQQAVEDLRNQILKDGKLPATLSPAGNGAQTPMQLVDASGKVLAGTPGATDKPLVDPESLWRPPNGQRTAAVNGQLNGQPATNGKPPLEGQPAPNGQQVSPPAPRPPNGVLPGGNNPANNPANNPGGKPLGMGQPLPGAPKPQSDVLPAARVNNPPIGNVDYSVTQLPLPADFGDVRIVAASPLNQVRSSIDALARTLTFTIPALVLLIAAATWYLTGRALRPVHAITRRVEEISASSLHERVPDPGSHDEVAHLARTMNEMLSRLERSDLRQKQFVSDASHELRSPVASIRTELEVALLHPEQTDWTAVATNVLAEDARLDQIVGDLLALARLSEQPDVKKVEEVDLDEVVAAEACRARRVAVDASGVVPVKVTGRPEELGRMVGHLLDNAARHANTQVAVSLAPAPSLPPGPPGSQVDGAPGVAASLGPGITLLVDDDGAGVPIEQRAAIFERFGREDEGRARDRGGAGLGLAVVKRIAERHGGAVSVSDSPLGGARFAVLLPGG